MLSSRVAWLLPVAALLASAAGCKARPDLSRAESLGADPSAANVALLIGWSGQPSDKSYLPGTAIDLQRLEALYSGSDFGFRVEVLRDPSKAEILEASQRVAAEVGSTGTLLWHYEGHGSKRGEFKASDTYVNFPDVAAAMRQARATPLRRLIVTIDACYSGNLVDGQNQVASLVDPGDAGATPDETVPVATTDDPLVQAVLQSNGDDFAAVGQRYQELGATAAPAEPAADQAIQSFATGDGAGLRLADGDDQASMYQEVVVLSSALSTQTAADWGPVRGGPFNVALLDTLQTYGSRYRDSAKIKHLLSAVKSSVSSMTSGKQVPAFRMEPADIGEEMLFVPTAPAAPTAPVTTPAASGTTGAPVTTGSATTTTTTGGDNCGGAWGYAWAPEHQRTSRGTCRDAKSYCQCWSTSRGCGLFPAGSATGAQPVGIQAPKDPGGGCYDACTDVAKANSGMVHSTCSDALVLKNAQGQLEAWNYARVLGGSAPVTTSNSGSGAPVTTDVTASSSSGRCATQEVATLNVTVASGYENAPIYVDGAATRSVGSSRTFTSPAICTDRTYTYTLQLQWQGGRSQQRTVQVTGGRRTEVSLP